MAFRYSSGRIFYFFLLAGLIFTSGGMLLALSYFTYGFVLLSLGILVLGNIWRLYKHTNKSIAFFFDAVRNNDTTLVFPVSKTNSSLDALYRSLNELNNHIQNIKLEAEVREKYYKAIIKQSDTGFIVMSKDNNIELINEAACLLAGINPGSSNLNLIKIKNNKLYQTLNSLRAGENITFKSYNKFAVQLLLLKATEIKISAKDLILYTIQDIRQELGEKEIESYQKLISILTHEIMNSLAPLTSISKTLNSIFKNGSQTIQAGELTDVHLTTTVQGLKAIEEQSDGLNNFVTNYRKLAKIPQPVIKEIDIENWIEQLTILYKELCCEQNINFDIKTDGKIKKIEGDKNLLNQVLINLLNNAIDALKTCDYEKKLQILFSQNQNEVLIQVGNNGPVIPHEIQDKIFVPFFTTKENGSGIGLSISSQIIKLHRGTLDVFSNAETGTIFTIKL